MKLEELVESFDFLGEWEERYRYIIDLGRKIEPLSTEEKREENLVPGCISQVWMVSEVKDEAPRTLRFRADSDSHIVKGLIAILLMLYNDKTPKEIIQFDPGDLFTKMGLSQHLSPNRRSGFVSMIQRIQQTAINEAK